MGRERTACCRLSNPDIWLGSPQGRREERGVGKKQEKVRVNELGENNSPRSRPFI